MQRVCDVAEISASKETSWQNQQQKGMQFTIYLKMMILKMKGVMLVGKQGSLLERSNRQLIE